MVVQALRRRRGELSTESPAVLILFRVLKNTQTLVILRARFWPEESRGYFHDIAELERTIPRRGIPKTQRFYYVYILPSLSGTLYTGISNSIYNRTLQHKGKENPRFTSKYDVNRLVYYEVFTNVRAAIRREKEIKGSTPKKKVALIESVNPKWEDLAEGWGEQLPPPSWQIRKPGEHQQARILAGPKTGPSE